MLRGVWW
jgi:uncharacterized membrane protein YdfJ with MMPL/SSD domain